MSDLFKIAGSALSAQSLRLNTVASNLANAGQVARTPDELYKERVPVFQALIDKQKPYQSTVEVLGVTEVNQAPEKLFNPGHPMADEEGYVYQSPINVVEQMVNMISASQSYQSNVEMLTTAKNITLNTLNLGK